MVLQIVCKYAAPQSVNLISTGTLLSVTYAQVVTLLQEDIPHQPATLLKV